MRRIAFLLVLAPLAVTAAACTSAGTTGSAAPPSPATAVGTQAATPGAPTSAPATTLPTTPTTTHSATPSPTASAAPSATPTATKKAGPAACLTKSLRVDVLRGSGIAGHQFAAISFTNVGPAPCAMSGVPRVTLLRGGLPLGAPATPTAAPVHVLTLAAGGSASTTLVGFSTCNAPNSDGVRVVAPGQTASVDAPLVLRGCRLEIDPVSVAD